MHRYLRARLDPAIPPRVSALAKAAGVSRASVWRWHKREAFRDWLEAEERTATFGAVVAVQQAVYHKALEGDLRAMKLFLQRFDPGWPGRRLPSTAPSTTAARREITLEDAARVLIKAGYEVKRRS